MYKVGEVRATLIVDDAEPVVTASLIARVECVLICVRSNGIMIKSNS